AVGMGNPHCVFFVNDVNAIDVATRGAAIENHALFPEATNVEFVQVRAHDELRMRVWERGAGITLACGSGACAAAVAASLQGLSDKRVNIELDGGWLTLDWRADGVWMTGPTTHVFSATLDPEFCKHL
ncbi:MAG: diaminopimelate epimerase, partial [Paracoccaceae bacterium]